MLDEMSSESLCVYAASSEDATELELELSQRLNAALAEIEMLVRDLAVKIAEDFRRDVSGDDA